MTSEARDMETKQEIYEKAMVIFTEYLKKNDLKMTRERRLILKELFMSDSHLEAEDLLLRFRRKGEKVSRATIYRSFDLLLKAKLIAKSDFGHNHYHYEKKFGQKHHDHMICESCGEVFEFSNSKLEAMQEEICRENNFRISSHSLQIFGICAKCQQKN